MIQSALDIGAGTFNIDNPPVTHLAGPEVFFSQFEKVVDEGNVNFFTGKTPIWSQGDIPLALAIAPDGLAVAPTGKRYTNEYMLDHFNTWDGRAILLHHLVRHSASGHQGTGL